MDLERSKQWEQRTQWELKRGKRRSRRRMWSNDIMNSLNTGAGITTRSIHDMYDLQLQHPNLRPSQNELRGAEINLSLARVDIGD